MRWCGLLVVWAVYTVQALDNGVGLKPAMGFNTWNHFRCDISEDMMKEIADTFVKLGLKDAGYEYVNLDDCWAMPNRSAEGLVADPSKFPSGMAALGEYIHSKGLKFGIYSSASSVTCLRKAASLYHEDQDAQLFAKWGVDYLKYDMCSEQAYEADVRNTVMRDALNRTGRPIYYQFGPRMAIPAPYAPTVGNAWRSTGDIGASWPRVSTNLEKNNLFAGLQEIGAWNDADMLEIGNGHFTTDEEKSHFALWCLVKSPLILGNDIRSMPAASVKIVTNRALIAVNKDPLGKQAILLSSNLETSGSVPTETAPCTPYSEGQRGWSYANETIMKGGKCLEAVTATNLQLANCTGSDQQKWQVPDPLSLSYIKNVHFKQCLTARNETGPLTLTTCAPPAPCTERFTCVYNPQQMWYFSPDPRTGRAIAGTTYVNFGGHYDDITQKLSPLARRQCIAAKSVGQRQVWGGPLAGGEIALGLFNSGDTDTTIQASWLDVAEYVTKGRTYQAMDLYEQKIVGVLSETQPLTLPVATHGVAALRLTPK